MKVQFRCPKCGYTCLEEIMVNVTVISSVYDIDIEDGVADCDYDDVGHEDGEVDRYQCDCCGFVLKVNGDTVNDLEGLALWFEENQK